MNAEYRSSEFESAMVSVWSQVLVQHARNIIVGGDTYAVRWTSKNKLAQVDFDVLGERIRGLEQNPQTKSRWAQLARQGSKVMQFLSAGRYIAVVYDGKITHFGDK